MFVLLGNLLSNFLRGPGTRRYPKVRRANPEGTRSTLEIEIDKCIFCGICQKKCPSNAIKVARDARSWTVDPYRCIVCGYCVDACPKKCLSMGAEHSRVNA